jgi:hypothetical protein
MVPAFEEGLSSRIMVSSPHRRYFKCFLVCLTGARICIIVALKQGVGYQKIASPAARSQGRRTGFWVLGYRLWEKQKAAAAGFMGSRCLFFFFR